MDVSVDTAHLVDTNALLDFVQKDLVQGHGSEGGHTGYCAELRENHLGTFKFDLKRVGGGKAAGVLQVRPMPTHA